MEISKTIKDSVCSIALEGRLDTVSAPDLETIFNEISESDVKELQLDFKGLDYISSAGLRVLLRGQRMMSEKGGMIITNVKDTVMEVFEMTGFIDILTIK